MHAQFDAMIHWICNGTRNSFGSVIGTVTESLANNHHHKSFRSSLIKDQFSIQCINIHCNSCDAFEPVCV